MDTSISSFNFNLLQLTKKKKTSKVLKSTCSWKILCYDEVFDEVPMGESLRFMKRKKKKAAKAFAKRKFSSLNQEQKVGDTGREDCNLL